MGVMKETHEELEEKRSEHLAASRTLAPNPPYMPRTPSHSFTDVILEDEDEKLMPLVAMVNSDTAETLIVNGLVNEK